MKPSRFCVFLVICYFVLAFGPAPIHAQAPTDPQEQETYQKYLDFFEEIYKRMDESYYYPVRREDFDRFLDKFHNEIYGKLDDKIRVSDFVLLRSGAFLVDFLKTPDDIFSALYPPQVAKEYEQEVLGKKSDLGIEGARTKDGFEVKRVEARSDAYQKGLRPADILNRFNGKAITRLSEKALNDFLNPDIGATVKIDFLSSQDKMPKAIEVVSQEYFKETVFPLAIPVPGVYGLQIQRFNQMTAEDLSRYVGLINSRGPSGLILDMRDNPGGPPLAAQAISSFFLTPNEEFAHFSRKNEEKNSLPVPEIPGEYRFNGPIVILVNQDSGSAAELFSGIMQKKNRAFLMGTNTAGQVFLKSMFTFDNDAMLLLVTARGHFPDGNVFDFKGLTPQYLSEMKGTDLVYFAAGFLSALTGAQTAQGSAP